MTSESRRKIELPIECYPVRRPSGPDAGRSYQEVDGMPTFDILPLNEARQQRNRPARGAAAGIYRVHPARRAGQAGKLEPGEGETTQAIRRRLTAAAEALGKELQVRGSANAVNFWTPDGRRRGSPARSRARSLPPRFLDPTARMFTATKNCGTRGR